MSVVDIDDFQKLKGDFLGMAEFELADIVGSIHHLKILRLKDNRGNETGKCIVRLDKVEETEKKEIKLRMGVDGVPNPGFFASRVSFIKIFKLRITSHNMQ